MKSLSKHTCFLLALLLAFSFCNGNRVQAQQKSAAQKQGSSTKQAKKQLATVSGVIEIDARKKFRVKYDEIKTSLRQIVYPKAVPVPSQWKSMKEEDRRTWLTKFYESDKGKAFLKANEKLISDAPSFDVKYNDKGDFVVYDVPPGEYGLQGRVDKEVDGITYAFEVFAKIEVLEDVDQIKLQPIPVEITPLFKTGQKAPPLNVATAKGKSLTFDLAAYKDHYIFLNFMNTSDQSFEYQAQVQQMYKDIGKSHKVKLVSIVMDEDQNKAIRWLLRKKYDQGSYAFTKGWDHETIRAYGVRSTPSGWLISPDAERKILMTQHEFFRNTRVKSSVTEIIKDRIEGKDTPTPATAPASEEKPAADAK